MCGMYKIITTIDNPITQKEFENQLKIKLRSMELVFSRNTHETMSALVQGNVSMLVLDMDSYQVDTLQIIAHLTQHQPHIPCFILGNHAIQETKVKLVERTYHYIKKPFDMYDLTLEMTEVLRRESHQVLKKGIPVKTFLQLVNLENKTCLLAILPVNGEKGLVYFNNGVLYDAVNGSRKGEAAAVNLLTIAHAEIQFKDPGKKIINRQIKTNFAEIMAKAATQKDTAAVSPPAKPAPVAPPPQPPPPAKLQPAPKTIEYLGETGEQPSSAKQVPAEIKAAPADTPLEKAKKASAPPTVPTSEETASAKDEPAETVDYYSVTDMPAPREGDVPADRTVNPDAAAQLARTVEDTTAPAIEETVGPQTETTSEETKQEIVRTETEATSPSPASDDETEAVPLVDILEPPEEQIEVEQAEAVAFMDETQPKEEMSKDLEASVSQDEIRPPEIDQSPIETDSTPTEAVSEEAEPSSEEPDLVEGTAPEVEQEPMETVTKEIVPPEETAIEVIQAVEQKQPEPESEPPVIEEEKVTYIENINSDVANASDSGAALQRVWNDHLGAIRAVRGYKAAALISPAGELVAFDSTDSKIHLDAMGGTFNAIFWLARDAYLRAGLESFGELALRTPRGIVVMTKPATGVQLPLQSLCILGEDGDQGTMQERLGLLLQDIMNKAS